MGKTTLARRLAHLGPVYEEVAHHNPHLECLRRGEPFDAFENQRWFLSRIEGFLQNHRRTEVVVVDQMPLAITHGYGDFFVDEKRLTIDQHYALRTQAAQLLDGLRRDGHRLLTVVLTARTETLWARIVRRPGPPPFDVDEVDRINRKFQRVAMPTPTLAMNTDIVGIDEELEAVESWLEQQLTKTESM